MYQVEDADYKSKNTLEIVEYWQDYLSHVLDEYKNILNNNNCDAISQIHVYLLIKYRDSISCTAGNDSFKTELGRRFKNACKTLKLSNTESNRLALKVSYIHEKYKNSGISLHYNMVNDEITGIIADLTERYGRGKSFSYNKKPDVLDFLKQNNELFEDSASFVDVEDTNMRICLMSYNSETPGLTNKETYNKLFYGEEVTDMDGNIIIVPQDNLIWLEAKGETNIWNKFEINQYCIARNKYTREPATTGDSNGRFRITCSGMSKSPHSLALDTFSSYGLEDRVVEDCYATHKFVFKSKEELYNPNKINFDEIGAFKCNDGKIYIFLNSTSFSHAATNIPNQVRKDYKATKYHKYGYIKLSQEDIEKVKQSYIQYYNDFKE